MKTASLILIWLVCFAGTAVTLLRMLWCIGANRPKAVAIAIALDRAGNRAANGGQAETISSRANRARAEGRHWGCVLCRWLDWLDPNHCRDSAGV